eukprot:5961985-Prymnesium_polylepis.1
MMNAPVSPIEWIVLMFVLGQWVFLIDFWSRHAYELKQLFAYSSNITDAIVVALQLAIYGMRCYGSVTQWDPGPASAPVDGMLEDEHAFPTTFRLFRMVVAVVIWYRALTYAETLESIGPLIMSVRRMFVDIRNFVVLAAATVLGFSFGLYALLSLEERQYVQNGGPAGDDSGPRLTNISDILVFAVYSMIGLLDADYSAFKPLGDVKYALVVVIFALYGICGAVLLINLLIAMMGNTYSQLQDKSRLAYEYENCRLFLFYDAHLGLPSPLNLLPFCAHPFVRLASWMRSKATAQAGGLVEDKPQDQLYCRHCLLNL